MLREEVLRGWKSCREKMKKSSIHNYPIMFKRPILGLNNYHSVSPLTVYDFSVANGSVTGKSKIEG